MISADFKITPRISPVNPKGKLPNSLSSTIPYRFKLNPYQGSTDRNLSRDIPIIEILARSTSLLQFVRRSAQLNQDNQPILVHCSAGSGRSGCFIVLDWMLRMADAEGKSHTFILDG